MTIADSGLALPARGTPPTVRAEKLRPGATRQGLRAIKDDWPRTHRILPWMLAMFIAVLWVVPFDAIQLNSSLPVNLKLDRLLLPVLVVVWGLAFVLSPRGKPRMKLTWIHGALFGFTGLAFLSSTLNAEGLNQLLQLDQGVKQLTLLAAYMTFFVIIASVVRPSEISAFLTYTLLLSVVAALGTLLEYRFHYNVFYTLSHQLFSGFQVAQPQTNMMDAEGRRLVEGPAGVSLEAVGMFTMALPIALARLTGATNSRRRVLYIAATSLLLAAMVSTERKSGLLGPLAVIIVFALVKRRQMLKLLPLAVVILAVIKVAAPAALGTVGNQIKPSAFGASTVDERVVRYDAIRPDLWLHPAMGSGYGTYIVRVMDNELLDRLLEGGVIGLVSYVTMIVMVGGVAFGVIRRRTPEAVMIGLIGASAAAATLILSSTYDLMAFPHNPYIFVSLAGLLAVAVKANDAAFNPPPRGSPTREPAWSR